jgi:hypothetical protein
MEWAWSDMVQRENMREAAARGKSTSAASRGIPAFSANGVPARDQLIGLPSVVAEMTVTGRFVEQRERTFHTS